MGEFGFNSRTRFSVAEEKKRSLYDYSYLFVVAENTGSLIPSLPTLSILSSCMDYTETHLHPHREKRGAVAFLYGHIT